MKARIVSFSFQSEISVRNPVPPSAGPLWHHGLARIEAAGCQVGERGRGDVAALEESRLKHLCQIN